MVPFLRFFCFREPFSPLRGIVYDWKSIFRFLEGRKSL